MEQKQPVIAFVGIGLMGVHMARNLLKAGFAACVESHPLKKAQALAGDGAMICDNPKDATDGADIIIMMVSDGPVVHELLFEQNLAAHIKQDAIVIDMSSIKASEAKHHAEKLATLGIGHLDAPVSGGTRGQRLRAWPSWLAVSAQILTVRRLFLQQWAGAHMSGLLALVNYRAFANQAIVGVTIGVVAEAMLFVEKGGADPQAVRAALKGGFADSTILQQHGARMTDGDFTPGGAAKFQLKDMSNVLDEADEMGLHLPMTSDLRDRFRRLVEELDGGDKDHAALYLELLNAMGCVGLLKRSVFSHPLWAYALGSLQNGHYLHQVLARCQMVYRRLSHQYEMARLAPLCHLLAFVQSHAVALVQILRLLAGCAIWRKARLLVARCPPLRGGLLLQDCLNGFN